MGAVDFKVKKDVRIDMLAFEIGLGEVPYCPSVATCLMTDDSESGAVGALNHMHVWTSLSPTDAFLGDSGFT